MWTIKGSGRRQGPPMLGLRVGVTKLTQFTSLALPAECASVLLLLQVWNYCNVLASNVLCRKQRWPSGTVKTLAFYMKEPGFPTLVPDSAASFT